MFVLKRITRKRGRQFTFQAVGIKATTNDEWPLTGSFTKPRRPCQRERHQTKLIFNEQNNSYTSAIELCVI